MPMITHSVNYKIFYNPIIIYRGEPVSGWVGSLFQAVTEPVSGWVKNAKNSPKSSFDLGLLFQL